MMRPLMLGDRYTRPGSSNPRRVLIVHTGLPCKQRKTRVKGANWTTLAGILYKVIIIIYSIACITEDEVLEALLGLNNGKAASPHTGIPKELLKYGGRNMAKLLMPLFT